MASLARGAAYALLLAAAVIPQQPGHSQSRAHVTWYRCVDMFDQVTLQNDVPCPAGTRQTTQVVEAVQTMPSFRAPVVAAQPASSANDATVAGNADEDESEDGDTQAREPSPPPALYVCKAPDNVTYFTENEEPISRCLPLNITGIGGLNALAVGEACQRSTDVCQAVPEAQLCERWQEHAKKSEAAWRFARSEDASQRQREYQQVQQVLDNSDCATR